MKTIHKLALAKVLYRVIRNGRRLAGKDDLVRVRRRGITWQLDLSEAIDLTIYVLGQFEPASARVYRTLVKAGDTVLDIGANVGAHTLPLARALGPEGRLIAFEPTRYAYRKLLANLALNPEIAGRVTAEQILLGSDTGGPSDEGLYASWKLGGAGERHAKHLGLRKPTTGASTCRLDDYLDRRGVSKVDFIKIDVDGHECEVLGGAQRTLARSRPVLLVEIAPYVFEDRGSSLEQYLELLSAQGYRLWTESGRQRLPMRAGELAARIGPDAVINAVARPG